jgi:beta-carotene 3-hydroxylase
MLFNTFLVLFTFCAMEFMAWFLHKYVMHGFLWSLHEDHHEPYHGLFQKNDAFFLVFAIPSWLLIMFGMMAGNDFRVWIGLGIAIYGFIYFVVHEVFIHRRMKWFKRTKSPYLKAIRKAHKVHHKTQGREGASCFGLLIVPFKFITEQYKR